MEKFEIISIIAFAHSFLSAMNFIFNDLPMDVYSISWIISFIACTFILLVYFYEPKTPSISGYTGHVFSASQRKILDIFKNYLDHQKKLTYIHIPKCGGSFVRNFLPKDQITYKSNHEAATKKDFPAFALIRHPVDRFESMLRFRLERLSNYPTLQQKVNLLHGMHQKIHLNNIARLLSDDEMSNIDPFQTLTYYSKNVQFLIPMELFIPMLRYLEIDTVRIDPSKKINASPDKKYGHLGEKQRNRVEKLYASDMQLYKFWTHL